MCSRLEGSLADMALDRSLTGRDIYQIMTGYQQSQVMHTACALGVFDILHNATARMTSDEVASSVQAETEATERLLNACVGIGLIDVTVDANGIVTYSNSTATEKYLVNSSAMSMKSLVLIQGDFYKMWGRLSSAIKNGTSQMPSVMGSSPELFEKGSGYYMTDEKQSGFMQCMHVFSRMDAPHILNAFDLCRFETACDLGGGTGAFGLELATKYRQTLVTVFDLSHVVSMASRFLPKAQPKNLSFHSGDFFRDPLPNADLYVLSHVIHDWNQAKINMLLSKVFKSLKPGGALLLCEKTLHEMKDGPVNTLLFDLGMLLGSEGKERTAEEYTTLLEQTGFTDIQVKQLPEFCFRDAILARKV